LRKFWHGTGLLQRKGRPVRVRPAARAAPDALLRVDRHPGHLL